MLRLLGCRGLREIIEDVAVIVVLILLVARAICRHCISVLSCAKQHVSGGAAIQRFGQVLLTLTLFEAALSLISMGGVEIHAHELGFLFLSAAEDVLLLVLGVRASRVFTHSPDFFGGGLLVLWAVSAESIVLKLRVLRKCRSSEQ